VSFYLFAKTPRSKPRQREIRRFEKTAAAAGKQRGAHSRKPARFKAAMTNDKSKRRIRKVPVFIYIYFTFLLFFLFVIKKRKKSNRYLYILLRSKE
jgi:hypothetical protein